MKRGFLVGLGSYLIFVALLMLYLAVEQAAPQPDRALVIIAAVISTALGLLTILAAKKAAPSRTRLHAIVGWFMGFFVIIVASWAAFIIWLMNP